MKRLVFIDMWSSWVEGAFSLYHYIVKCRTATPYSSRSLAYSYQQLHSRLGYVQDNTSYCKRCRGSKISHSCCLSDDSSRFPAWLEECIQTRKRANERLHSLSSEVGKCPPLEQEVDLMLQTNSRTDLFAPCRFLLLGFDEETDIYRNLGKLMRRAKGTIYWELNEMITHIIVADDCDDCHR